MLLTSFLEFLLGIQVYLTLALTTDKDWILAQNASFCFLSANGFLVTHFIYGTLIKCNN